MRPKVSIIIPTYNRDNVISETLTSVSRQSESDFECIIVDDFSRDHTVALVHDFCLRDQRFHLVVNDENKGACFSRNYGLSIAQGKYVCFLDSDDIWHTSYLYEQILTLEQRPEAGLAVANTLRYKVDISEPESFYKPLDEPVTLSRYLTVEISWVTSSALWRSEVVRKLGGFSLGLEMWQDWELNARYLAGGGHVAVTQKTLVYYRNQWDGNQITSSNKKSKKSIYNFFLSRHKLFKYICLNKLEVQESSTALTSHFIYAASRLFYIGYWRYSLKALSDALIITKSLHPIPEVVRQIYRLSQ